MFTLHKVEARNIRSLGHVVFTPLTDGGMTALNGPNGSGKSSILHALVWALYGVTPDGVPQSAMRRQGTEDTQEPCRVVVTFEHDGQIIEVERGLKGRKDAPYMMVTLNGVEQAKGRIRAAEAWVKAQLGGLDAEGFLTAFVIRQKELDGLVKAKPAERRKLIERLAGIDRMSTAVKTSREEETEVRKRLDLLPGNPEALDAARQAVETAQQAAAARWEDLDAAKTHANTTQTALDTATVAVEEMRGHVLAHREAETRLGEARTRLGVATSRAEAATAQRNELAADADGGTPEALDAAKARHEETGQALARSQQATQAAAQARQAADQASQTARQHTDRLNQARQRHQSVAQAHADDTRALADAPTDLDARITQTTQAVSVLADELGALRGERERLIKAVATLDDASAHDRSCPTCASPLADPDQLARTLREAAEKIVTEGTQKKARHDQLAAQIDELRAQAAQQAQLRERVNYQADALEAAATALRDAETSAQDAQTAAEEARSTAEAAQAAAEEAVNGRAALAATHDAATAHLGRVQAACVAATRLAEATERAEAANRELDQARTAHAAAEAEEVARRAATTGSEEVRQAHLAATEAHTTATRAADRAEGDFRVAEEQVVTAERTRDHEAAKMQARAEAYELLEHKTATREALDQFRKNRIASLAPELSEIATEQIARMTDQKFVAIELDEEFTAIITDDQGRQRPASWLSGGEESAVALALRLSIGEVISGQRGGLLWMDEPQTAMDAARRPAMMSVIGALPGRQPIIISHVTEATDMVDHVVEVVPDAADGSTLAIHHGPTDTAAAVDALDAITG